jgi:hypothetical protein
MTRHLQRAGWRRTLGRAGHHPFDGSHSIEQQIAVRTYGATNHPILSSEGCGLKDRKVSFHWRTTG